MATGLITVSAAQLQAAELPPLKFVVENFLPQGLTVLAALPKYGKSWFVLNLCIAIATGQPFLNRNTTQGGSLYLSLEDSHRRLQDRINKVLDGRQAPQNLDLSINAEGLSGNLIEDMERYLKNKPDTSLIVIDTLQKIRDIPKINNNIYFTDYSDLSKLKMIADRYGVCVLLVHHLRKMTDGGDIFNQISGSTGLVGAADTIFVLSKAKRSDGEATLSVISRDIEEIELLLTFDKVSGRWRLVGDAEEEAERRDFEEYQKNPLVRTIKLLLQENPNGFAMTTTEIRDKCLELTKTYFESVQSLGVQIRKIAHQLYSFDGILYNPPNDGNRSCGERRHTFAYKK